MFEKTPSIQHIHKGISKLKLEVLKHEELCELVLKAQNGNMEARNKIINHNLKLVMKAVYSNLSICSRFPRIEIEDLFQEAIFGIVRSIELFDVNSGNQFSTYAQFWIDQKIKRYIDLNKTLIHFPVYASSLQKQFTKLEMQYEGRDEDFYLRLIAFENDISVESVKNALYFLPKDFSIDGMFSEQPEGDDDPYSYMEEGLAELTWEPEGLNKIDTYHIFKMASFLSERDKKILTLRMDNYSLVAISEMMKMSRERVRQIESQSLTKLKAMVNRVTNRRKEKYHGRV